MAKILSPPKRIHIDRQCVCRSCLCFDLEAIYISDRNITKWEDDFIGKMITVPFDEWSAKQRITAINILSKYGMRE
jgi:hypothetical protein